MCTRDSGGTAVARLGYGSRSMQRRSVEEKRAEKQIDSMDGNAYVTCDMSAVSRINGRGRKSKNTCE